MALQPLDLQALFTQMDKVGKMQMAQREGVAIQQSLQGVATQKKVEEQVQSVDTVKDGEESEGIKNQKNAQKRSKDQQDGGKSGGNDENPEEAKNFFKDPGLGRNIDLSG